MTWGRWRRTSKRGMEGRTHLDFRKGVKDIVIEPSWLNKYIPGSCGNYSHAEKGARHEELVCI